MEHCIRCGDELTPKNSNAGTNGVCTPCLIKQGKCYQKTGNIGCFISKNGNPIIPEYERSDY